MGRASFPQTGLRLTSHDAAPTGMISIADMKPCDHMKLLRKYETNE